MAKCEYCGEEVSLPYKCGYCGRSFCPRHRLPENHECDGLKKIDRESEEEDEVYSGVSEDLEFDEEELEEEPETDVSYNLGKDFDFDREFDREEREREERPFSPVGSITSMLKNIFFNKVTTIVIFIAFLTFIGQQIAHLAFGPEYIYFIAPARDTVLTRPWTILTSIFAHGNSWHLFINALVLFFIGSTLESGIGKKKFTELFLVSGSIGALGQIAIMTGGESMIPVVGASGAIMGLLGALTVLAPRLPVLLFFFIPMKLWMLTLGYGAIETILAFTGALQGIGHVAHLSGLAVGLIYGYRFRQERKRQAGSSYSVHVSRY